MAKANLIFTNFSAGEYSPRLYGRVDTDSYFQSCRTLVNAIMVSQGGGADRRPGTKFAANGKHDSKKVRLISFEHKNGSYVLEIGDSYTRFYKYNPTTDEGEQIENGGSPYEVATQWAEADLPGLKYAQTKDALYIVHPDYAPTKITTTGDTNWTVNNAVDWGTDNPGFNDANKRPRAIGFYQQRLVLAYSHNEPQRIWLSNVGNPEDFSTGNFLNYQVYHNKRMAIMWLTGKQEINWGAGNAEGVLIGGAGGISDSNYDLSVQTGCGSADIQGVMVGDQVLYVQKGTKRVRAFQYSQSTERWKSYDLTIYADHITGSGIVETALQINPDTVLWCVRSDGVLAGLTLENDYGVMGWHRQITDGASGKVESIAIIPGGTEDMIWIAVQRTVNSVTKRFIEYLMPRDFGSDQKDCYFVDCGITNDEGTAKNVTGVTQDHPTKVTAPGHSFVADDKVKFKNIEGSEELNGQVWTVQNPAGDTFELKETDDYSDWDSGITYYEGNIVKYGTKNYIALQESTNKQPDVETDYWALWPTTYTSGGTVEKVVNEVSGLDHLEGEIVDILADGATHPQKTVASGKVTLDRYANKIHVGLHYNSDIQPMRLEGGGMYGTAQGKIKSINRITIRFYKTLGCKIGPDADHLRLIVFRKGSDPMDSPPPLYTGDKEKVFNSGWDKEGNIYIRQDQPLPMSILAIMPEVVISDAI